MDGDDLNNAVLAVFNIKYHPYVQSDYINSCITDSFLDSPQNVLNIPLASTMLSLSFSLIVATLIYIL